MIIRPPQINFSFLLNMSQSSLKEKLDNEQLFSTTLAIELEDVEKTLAQRKIRKTQIYTQWTVQLERGLMYEEKFQRNGQYRPSTREIRIRRTTRRLESV